VALTESWIKGSNLHMCALARLHVRAPTYTAITARKRASVMMLNIVMMTFIF